MIRRVLSSLPHASLAALACVVLSCSSSSGGSGNPSDAASTAKIPSNVAQWCSNPAPSTCSQVGECGVCVAEPPAKDVVRTTDTKEYAGTGAPDLSCDTDVTTIKPLDAANSKTVTLRGYVRIFANGPDSDNVKVEIIKEAAGGSLGDTLGTTTTGQPLADGTGTITETITRSGVESQRILYPYSIDGIPTETPFLVRTSSKTSISADGWFPLYDYNEVIRNDGAACNGDQTACFKDDTTYVLDVRALGNDDYSAILKAAYNRTPEGGQSALAGEVHDCGDVRLSNATVGVSPSTGYGLFYLSEDEDDPLPDLSRSFTGKLGLYAAGGLKPDSYHVAAVGRSGGALVGLGSYDVQTFPDSVTVLTFRGVRPWQLPAK